MYTIVLLSSQILSPILKAISLRPNSVFESLQGTIFAMHKFYKATRFLRTLSGVEVLDILFIKKKSSLWHWHLTH